MPPAHPPDLQLHAVYGVWWDGLAYSDVADRLSMGPMRVTADWVKTMWKLFMDTGGVESRQGQLKGQRDAPPANLIIDDAAARVLVDQLLDSPSFTLNEHKAEFEASTGKAIHISTFYHAVWRLGFTRQKLQHYAQARDEHAAALFRL